MVGESVAKLERGRSLLYKHASILHELACISVSLSTLGSCSEGILAPVTESSGSFDAVLSSQTLGFASSTIDKMAVAHYILRVRNICSFSNIKPVFLSINQRPWVEVQIKRTSSLFQRSSYPLTQRLTRINNKK
jgi:hypothetical protein